MSKSLKDTLVVGFAMFAVFFGAGNLIFPPWIGQMSGDAWLMGLLGLLLTGILLPIMAVLAVGNGGGTFKALTQPVSSWFYQGYNFLIMICLGMLITHPRVGAVAYETGVRTLLPGLNQTLLQPVTLVIFFAIAAYFSINASKVVDKVGQILTPLLLAALAVIIGLAVFNPIGTPVATGVGNAFYAGFVNAYQIGDVLTGLLCGVILATLTTSVGLMTVISGYIHDLSKGRVPYWAAVIGVALVAVVQAMGGVAKIIVIAGPIFMFVYPLSIVIVLLGIFKKVIPNVGVWKGSVLAAAIIGCYDSVQVIFAINHINFPEGAAFLYHMIPLATEGFAWIVPSLLGGLAGGFIFWLKDRSRQSMSERG